MQALQIHLSQVIHAEKSPTKKKHYSRKSCKIKSCKKKNSQNLCQFLHNFTWVQLFLRARFSAFNVFRSSFCNLFGLAFWVETYPSGSNYQEVFSRITTLKFWAKWLKVNCERVRLLVNRGIYVGDLLKIWKYDRDWDTTMLYCWDFHLFQLIFLYKY